MKNKGIKFKLSNHQIESLKTFTQSNLFQDKNSKYYSDYWKDESNQMDFRFIGTNQTLISGSSGFYIPTNKYKNILKKLLNIYFYRKKIIPKIKSFYSNLFSRLSFISYKEAFNYVMMNHEITDPDHSIYRFNHLDNSNKFKNIISSYDAIVKDYKKWTSMNLNMTEDPDPIINAYYYRNLLIPFLNNKKQEIFLEIGAGTGNLASILVNLFSPKIYIIIDLPETLINSYIFLSSKFPNFDYVLPDKFNKKDLEIENNNKLTKFLFLLPSQINLIPSNFVDLSINTHSFQEMNKDQIIQYFSFIYRTAKNDSFFFCANRVEKIPTGKNSYKELQTLPPNNFYNYPWGESNKILINEVSRLHRIVCADSIAIKLEKIKKDNE